MEDDDEETVLGAGGGADDVCARSPCADGAGNHGYMHAFSRRQKDAGTHDGWAVSDVLGLFVGSYAYVEIEAEESVGGLYVQFYEDIAALEVQITDDAGAWRTVAVSGGSFLNEYIALDAGTETVRIRPKDGKGRLFIAELHVFGEGDAPDWVQQWEAPLDKADLLALAAHPDDELLFLGGTIPYYAGERAGMCRWPTLCRRCHIGGWNCWTVCGSAG